ncbi:hypothetical protein [Delftia phage PhiW-14]|uniref:Uncharacterized protein n=1 Tax=Delftia phage PhiW-14 TaxID=665032 RepID=C9DG07_BPW14|nr:hypothetical protein DP-phiW-14_gp035 [Delftia phage PhiW-14]ACV50058.1 hypothetical protein [Delftia phage PhiW-14]
MSDSNRFDLSVEIGQRVNFMGSAKMVTAFEEILNRNEIPPESGLMLLLDKTHYTGGDVPEDKAIVKEFIRLLTEEPGSFHTFDEACHAIKLGLTLIQAYWQQRREEKRSKIKTVEGCAAGVVATALISVMAPWCVLAIIPFCAAGGLALFKESTASQLAPPVYERIKLMLQAGREQSRVL